MEKTNKIVEILDEIFETICMIYDKTELNFDSGAVLVQKFQKAFELAKNLNTKDIAMEIWNATSVVERHDELNYLIKDKFEKLITWKPDTRDIEALNNQLLKDLVSFYQKQTLLNRNYGVSERGSIDSYYKAINHRLLKANLDLYKATMQLQKMAEVEFLEAEFLEAETKKIIKQLPNNSSIEVNYKAKFADVLLDLYTNKFYPSINTSVPLAIDKVLLAFSEFLKSEFDYKPSSNSVDSPEELNPKSEVLKAFPLYLLHKKNDQLAKALKSEFSTEKCKAIRLMFAALEQNEPPLISIGNRQSKAIHKALQQYFDRDIGSCQGVFGYKIQPGIDDLGIGSMKTRINHVLQPIEKE